MKIIAVINEKGGTGKSTLSTNLATAFHRQGKKTILIDADPQGTARDWRAESPEDCDLPSVIGIDRAGLIKSIKDMEADIIIVDGPAKAGDIAAAIVRIAHIALVVIQPSGADIWASAATVKLIHAKTEIGGEIDAAFLINRAKPSATLSKTVKEGDWNDYKIDQLQNTVGDRQAFVKALSMGQSVFDLDDSKAINEINNVIKELEDAKWLA